MSLTTFTGDGKKALESIWEVARRAAAAGMDPWYKEKEMEDDSDDGDGPPIPEQTRKRAMSEHVGRRRA